MDAKCMFKILDYECDISYDGILYSKYIVLSNGNVANCQIEFDKNEKTVEKTVFQAGFKREYYDSKITLKELEAINKQVKELNW